MYQDDLDREISQATGESLRTIRHRGFQLVMPELIIFDPEPNDLESQVYDWDLRMAQPLASVA